VSNFDEKTVDRIKRLEREVERLRVKERPVVITDHGALTGLGDDDHTQYVKASDLGVWTAYTPTWTAATTNPSIGNGTLAGRYTQIGKTCVLVIGLTMGSTTTFGSGNWSFSLPKTAKKTSGINFYGVAHIRKGGTANYERVAQISPSLSTTVINMFTDPTPGSNSQSISATVPFTWGNGDSLGFQITYEIA